MVICYWLHETQSVLSSKPRTSRMTSLGAFFNLICKIWTFAGPCSWLEVYWISCKAHCWGGRGWENCCGKEYGPCSSCRKVWSFVITLLASLWSRKEILHLHLHLHHLALGKVPFWLVAVFAYVASYTTSLFRNIFYAKPATFARERRTATTPGTSRPTLFE